MDPVPLNKAIGGAADYGSLEEEEQTKRAPSAGAVVKAVLVPVFGVVLLASCLVAAFVGATALSGNSGPTVKLHGLLAELGFASYKIDDGLMCMSASGPPQANMIPKWDPDFFEKKGWDDEGKPASARFYRSCYRAYRCCTTSTQGCFPGAGSCQSCLKQNGPRVVKPPCEEWLQECKPGSNTLDQKCQATDATKDWNKRDLMLDNGTPMSTKPKWALIWNNMKKYSPTCWKQRPGGDTELFAEKCWEVISWCHQNMHACPRDGKTFGHTKCKHCMLSRYDQHATKGML